MQMIDVLKRLAELDAANPNVVSEKQVNELSKSTLSSYADKARSQANQQAGIAKYGKTDRERPQYRQSLAIDPEADYGSDQGRADFALKRSAGANRAKEKLAAKEGLEECGMMPEMGMMSLPPERPSTPASINMTAGSGEELSDMLTTIMTLAGQKPSSPLAAMPVAPAAGALEPAGDKSATDSMRSVIDKLNPMDGDDAEDDEKVDEYDNTPADPNDKNEFDADQHAHQENQPGQGDRMDGTAPKAYSDMNEAVADLFAQYKKFVAEN